MIHPASLRLIVVACFFPMMTTAAASEKPAADRPRDVPAAAQALVAVVNTVVATDIGIPSGDVAICSLDALPSSRAKILPLLPPEHRRLIAECARGRTRLRRNVRGFNLLALLEDPVEATAETTALQAFFDDRTVDLAIGAGVSGEPYPIAFDWVVVLDAEAQGVFSFIVNCRD